MIKRNLILFFLTILIFPGIYSLLYLVDLDSVYYFKEAYFDLTSSLGMWSAYDVAFGGAHLILWLYPVTYFAGLIGQLFTLDWNVVVRIVFYFPSILLTFISAKYLAKKVGIGNQGQFLSGLIYLFNTYFLLLVDGGQLGIMLAYSVLPFAVEAIINFKFFKTVAVLSLIATFDPRFLVLGLVLGILLSKINLIKYLKLSITLVFVTLICAYWIYPLIMLGNGIGVNTFVSNLQLTKIIHPFLLYQPHWPYNIFGKITKPEVLFLIFPSFLLVSMIYKFSKEKLYWMILFILFAFLTKGENKPFGFIYSYLLNLPFASAFRDSTKFFTPLILIYSLIVSRFYDEIKNKLLIWTVPILIFIPLIPGLVFGTQNNLKGTSDVSSLLRLKEEIKDDNFARTIYIPQRPQLSYQTETNQAIDGRVMSDYLPFAADNYGSEDRFNFMRRDNYINYFKALGIKNLVYISKNEPVVAKLDNTMPERYYIDKLAVVAGSPIEVEKLVPEYGVLFLEDGKTNLDDLLSIPNKNLFFVLNNKNKNDLVLSGLNNKLIDLSRVPDNQWGKYSKDEYLTWKYQLLIRGIDTKEINFENGIVLSTQKNEEIKLNLDLETNYDYKVFVRGMSGKDSDGLYLNNNLIKIPSGNNFNWVETDMKFDNGKLIIKNNGGFNIIGAILVIKKDEYQMYLENASKNLSKYQILDINSKLPESKISFDKKEGWMIWNHSYDARWDLNDKQPYSINSMTNGFYVSGMNDVDTPFFEPQKYLDFGVKISLASVFVLFMSYLGYVFYRKYQKAG